jgi:hypothetical protein
MVNLEVLEEEVGERVVLPQSAVEAFRAKAMPVVLELRQIHLPHMVHKVVEAQVPRVLVVRKI